MKVYSRNLFHFAERLEKKIKSILKAECHLEVRRSRFVYNKYTYPIKVVFFENQNQLGYFDPHTYHIGLNVALIYNVKEDVLLNIIRHELAHYIQFLETEHPVLPHGEEFKLICERYGWSDKVSKSSLNIDLANSRSEGNLEQEKMMSKVKRLLDLATSDNVHEAELATIKANELILKYNLQHYQNDDDQRTYVAQLIKAKRKNSKLTCIYEIISHFMVKPILIYGKSQVAVEVCGSKESIELAKYVCDFLDKELEELWINQKSLKGLKEKNSFFMGIAKGYSIKINNVQSHFTTEQNRSLVTISQNLNTVFNQIYKSTSSSYSKQSSATNAFSKGMSAGQNLHIQSTIKNSNKKTKPKLTWNRYE